MKFSKSSILLMISGLTMMIGCSDQKIDPFLVGDAKCSPPCWMSVTPGFTTKSEAVNIVLNLVGKQNYSSSENDIYARYKGKSIHVYSNSTNQMVDGIDLDMDDTRLKPLIDEFGEPKYLSITIDQGCTFTIYYPDKGLHFLGQCEINADETGWVVSPNSMMTGAFFTKQGLEIKELLVLFFGKTSADLTDAIVLWKGYGVYK